MMKRKETISLKRRILVFLLLCWVVPTAVFFTVTTLSYRESIVNKTEGLIEDRLDTVLSYASIRLDAAIRASQKPSYDGVWESGWRQYQDGKIDRNEFLRVVNNGLKSTYGMDKRFDTYVFYVNGEEEASCYSSRAGRSYGNYIEAVEQDIKKIAAENTSYTYVRIIDKRMFIIRNLYTTEGYECFGTLAMEVNINAIFDDVPKNMEDNLIVCMDEPGDAIDFATAADAGAQKLIKDVLSNYDKTVSGELIKDTNQAYNVYLLQKQYDDYHIGVVYWDKRSVIYSNLYRIYLVVSVMLLLFVPVIVYAAYFLRRQIQNPIEQLMEAAELMEAGQLGVEVNGLPMPNQEFEYLKKSFDSMSHQVKYLFKYVYDEKLARKEAQIQALQAQINPHFLNNTLEMMNWQARMSGDVVVSKMIESLSTVLDYRMNRANVKEIHLAEELQCTDAYFYIMSMRFGQRLHIEKEIDEDLLYIFVPPLILQPIAENAIVHGVETAKTGAIRLKIYHDEDKVYFKVYNSGRPLSDEDIEKIQTILAGEEYAVPKFKNRHTSIGIRNVNQRIKLVYGERYGLNIERAEDGLTVSTITIPYHGEELVESDNETDSAEWELNDMQKTKKDKWQE